MQRMDHFDEDMALAKEAIQKLVTEGTITIEFIRALEQHGNVKVLVPQLMSTFSKVSLSISLRTTRTDCVVL
jgi:hypothetical protein